MGLSRVIEGPMLWAAFGLFVASITVRSLLFLATMAMAPKNEHGRYGPKAANVAKAFFPLHKLAPKRPLYSCSIIGFHILLVCLPLFFMGHVMLLQDSRLAWGYPYLSYKISNLMTLALLFFCLSFIGKRVFDYSKNRASALRGIPFILLVMATYGSGYLLAQGRPGSFGDSLWSIHILCAESILVLAAFLFIKIEVDHEKCMACESCASQCPTLSLSSHDEEEQGLRVMDHVRFLCVCCGACIKTCPEKALEFSHYLSCSPYIHAFSKTKINKAELSFCGTCRKPFATRNMIDKLESLHIDVTLCPSCRRRGQITHV